MLRYYLHPKFMPWSFIVWFPVSLPVIATGPGRAPLRHRTHSNFFVPKRLDRTWPQLRKRKYSRLYPKLRPLSLSEVSSWASGSSLPQMTGGGQVHSPCNNCHPHPQGWVLALKPGADIHWATDTSISPKAWSTAFTTITLLNTHRDK